MAISKTSIITRFAPSPTGYLHIGAARTALFNWLYARKYHGKFLLRIEDTDKKRSTQQAVHAILTGLDWLGIHWDEDVVFQSHRFKRHKEIVQSLIEKNMAYKCYASLEEIKALRKQAFSEGRAFRSPWRDSEYGKFHQKQDSYTIRIKVPENESIEIIDHLQGKISWKNKELDDFVLLRADGSPTYMLSVVIDDYDMQISHIIRGDDHLVNAARQSLIYKAINWKMPEFTHIPLIHGEDGKKLSKRHGALGIEHYKEMGLLPEGLLNYLIRLGWSHGDQEIFTIEEMLRYFDLDGFNKAAARLNLDKAKHINGFHLRKLDDSRLIELITPYFLKLYQQTPSQEEVFRLNKAIGFLKEHANTLEKLAENSFFLIQKTPIQINDKQKKLFDPETLNRLSRIRKLLITQTNWSDLALSDCLKTFIQDEKIRFAQIGKPLRALLTGEKKAPDLIMVMHWLGKQEVLNRIDYIDH